MLGFSMFNTVAVYFMTYNVGMNESQQAIFWIFYVAVVVLDVFGYDGTVDIQSAGALKGISALATLFPAILFTIALIILAAYPITKKKYNLLCAVLEKKRGVEPHSTEGFEDLL